MNEPSVKSARPPEDLNVQLAAERTLLAWVRTALALMGFGFVVARFGLFLREIAAVGHTAFHERTTGLSLWLGTALIALGVATSLLASAEYLRFLRRTRRRHDLAPRTSVLAIGVSLILASLGIVLAVYLVAIKA